MTLSLMVPGLVAGSVQEMLGYRRFFIFVLVTFAVTFGVTLLLRMMGQNVDEAEESEEA